MPQQILFESDVGAIRESGFLEEGSFDTEKGEITVTVIKPGFNASKGRYYPSDVLRRDFTVFENAKMFLDHATREEDRARPEGSIRNWVASLKSVWAEQDGTIKGRAVVIDDSLKSKLTNLASHGILSEMGVSIRANGEVVEKEVEGRRTNLVERLTHGRSVDFVTFPGAGGRVEVLEADKEPSNTLPPSNTKEKSIMEDLNKQLQEALEEIKKLKAHLEEKDILLAESARKAKQAETKAELDRLLSESGIPEVSRKRIAEKFAGAETAAGIAESIDSEKRYIDDLAASHITKTEKPKVQIRNLGESHPPAIAGPSVNRVDIYRKLGMSEASAKVAAGIR